MANGNCDVTQNVYRTRNSFQAHCPQCRKTVALKAQAASMRRICNDCRSAYRWRLENYNERATTAYGWLISLGSKVAGGGTQSPSAPVDTQSIVRAVIDAIEPRLTVNVKLEEIEKRMQQRLEEMTPRNITIEFGKAGKLKPTKVDGHRHPKYEEVLDCLNAAGKVMMVGPAGTGKSTMGKQLAGDLHRTFGFLSCTEGISEAHLLGRQNHEGKYLPADFVNAFEGAGRFKKNGGLWLFDEVDAMDSNTSLSINEALANGHMSVPNRNDNPIAERDERLLFVASANTYGTGTSLEYSGRNQLDAAFMDRFVCLVVEVDYDRELEQKIATEAGLEKLLTKLWKTRDNLRAAKVRRVVSTRFILHSAYLHKVNPERYTEEELYKRLFFGWTGSECAKAEGI